MILIHLDKFFCIARIKGDGEAYIPRGLVLG